MSPRSSLRLLQPLRQQSRHSSCSSPARALRISALETEASAAQLKTDLEPLLQRWRLTSSGDGIERVVRFRTFGDCWKWMSTVATECKRAKHHPEWTNVYNRTHIRWTTHSPPGLSSKDIALAKYCDEAAKDTEVEATEVQRAEDEAMMNQTQMGADECCTRKET